MRLRISRLLPLSLAMLAASSGILFAQVANKSHDAAVTRNLTTFNALVKELELNYVDSIRTDEAFQTAIDALLSTIDPYTEYYTADDTESLETITTGEYGGIGSYITSYDGWSYISQPYKNSPADLGGLKPGDKLLRIDSVDLKGVPTDRVTKLLKGLPGTTVNIQVERPYVSDSIMDFNIVRRKLVMPTVSWSGVVNDSIGYIELTSFNDKSPAEVHNALDSLMGLGIKGLILDLRGNGGGVLSSAVDIVGEFVPKGTEVLRTRGKDAKSERIYKTTKSPLAPRLPLAVLIDGGSASSSEITAGALQDLDRAVLVGNRSYGKGLVQSARPLPFDGLLKVTIAKYYIPSGRLIQALDYSHRNPDGTVARTPDSLTHVFKTLNGREVRDGGGLIPDSTLEGKQYTRLLYNLVRDNWFFKYANKYAATHPSVDAPAKFVVTDEVFEDFKSFIDPEKFQYDKPGDKLISNIRETLKYEGYLNEETEARIDSLAAVLNHDLNQDLDAQRQEISRFLGQQLMGRYYYTAGETEFSLREDPDVQAAAAILANKQEYNKILGIKK